MNFQCEDMLRKRVILETTTAAFRCPECSAAYPIDVPTGKCLEFIECRQCGELIETPSGVCCIICAFTDSKCDVSISKKEIPEYKKTKWVVE